MSSSSSSARYWLLKAEPDTRIVKGKDVKFSVDDFERAKTSPWEGVRNYEARNLMREMKEGEKALFYHSNCKVPGIAAFAQVSKEAYPDYTAWDSSHPYYDPKSDSKEPKWFMIDLTFTARAPHFVPLALLRKIADLTPSQGILDEIAYLGEAGVASIKNMDLITRGRLSVQRVEEGAWKAINELAEKGGWEEMDLRPGKKGKVLKDVEPKSVPMKAKAGSNPKKSTKSKPKKKELTASVSEEETKEDNDVGSEEVQAGLEEPAKKVASPPAPKAETKTKRKREAQGVGESERDGLRRSTRARK